MAIDTPARLAVLGAGPIGLETALYARFLGYDVDVYERGRVAEHVRRWGHVRMFSPFSRNCSSLGLRALAAQDETYRPPTNDQILTGDEWVDRYLAPLAQTDLLSDSIKLGVNVVSVARAGLLKGELADDADRGDLPFRLLLKNAEGEFCVAEADGVIDTTGVFGQPNFLGEGGQPAIGELVPTADSTRDASDPRIEYGIPDVLGAARELYAGKHTVVVGSGHSAATSVVALAKLSDEASETRITWITRSLLEDGEPGPVAREPDDWLPERMRLTDEANRKARGGAEGASPVTHLQGTAVHALRRIADDSQWELELLGIHAGTMSCDRLIANVGHRPDLDLFRELHVAPCHATESPSKHAAEPNFYVLGAKSRGRMSQFLFQDGLEQIRRLFQVLGDRATLDLYAATAPLPR